MRSKRTTYSGVDNAPLIIIPNPNPEFCLHSRQSNLYRKYPLLQTYGNLTTANLGSNNGDAPVIIRNNISMFYFLSDGSGTVGQIRAGNSTMASKISASHNLVYGPQVCSSEFPSCVEVGTRISAPPSKVFKNPAGLDLRLISVSPAIDKGYSVGFVTFDIEGNPRPIGDAHDIGTFEGN